MTSDSSVKGVAGGRELASSIAVKILEGAALHINLGRRERTVDGGKREIDV